MQIQPKAILKDCPLCRHMTDVQLDVLLSTAGGRVQAYEKGAYIFSEEINRNNCISCSRGKSASHGTPCPAAGS